jgi:hypothetical protein
VVPFFGAQAAEDGQPLAKAGQLRQMLAKAKARGARGDLLELAAVFMTGLQVEGIGLRWSAAHPQEHAMPLALGICLQSLG